MSRFRINMGAKTPRRTTADVIDTQTGQAVAAFWGTQADVTRRAEAFIAREDGTENVPAPPGTPTTPAPKQEPAPKPKATSKPKAKAKSADGDDGREAAPGSV